MQQFKNMDTKDFQTRIESAKAKIRQQIDQINRTANSRSLNVLDTGVGGSEHSYRIEERRRINGKIDREACTITGTLYGYIDFLSNCQNSNELWQWLQRELIPRPIYKEKGGIDWPAWWEEQRKSPLNTEFGRQYGQALQKIYSCFWV